MDSSYSDSTNVVTPEANGAEGLVTTYFIDYLPSDVRLSDVLIIAAISLLMAFLATLYPSWAAARTQPAEALRYE